MMKAKIEKLPVDLERGKGIIVSSENEEEAALLEALMYAGGTAVMMARGKDSVEITIAPPAPDEK